MNKNKAELPRTLLHVKPLVGVVTDVDKDRAKESPLQRQCQRMEDDEPPIDVEPPLKRVSTSNSNSYFIAIRRRCLQQSLVKINSPRDW